MATDSPVYNRLQSVVYRLPFMYNLWATATATDRNSGQPDRKSGCLWSIFRSGPVQFPVYMTGLSNTNSESGFHIPHSKLYIPESGFCILHILNSTFHIPHSTFHIPNSTF